MSRLSELLGVPEGREFTYNDGTDMVYFISGNLVHYNSNRCETAGTYDLNEALLFYDLIKEKLTLVPELTVIPENPQLTDQQITAIKGRIAEGTPWAARDKDRCLYFYSNEPKLDNIKEYFQNDDKDCVETYSDIYDFITFENSPVYLPDLIEGSEGA